MISYFKLLKVVKIIFPIQRVMLINYDMHDRVQKQRKSKLYKNMLDEQIRDNQYYKSKKSRIQTQPNYNGQMYKLKQNDSLRLKQQSLFLPILSKTLNNNQLSPRESLPVIKKRVPKQRTKHNYRHYSYTKKIDDSDQQLQKCLYDCEQIIGQYGNHNNSNIKKKLHSKSKSVYNNILDDSLQAESRFKSPMPNKYNDKRDQIVHMSIPTQQNSYKKLYVSEDYCQKQQKTLRKGKQQEVSSPKNFQTIKYLSQHDTILNQQDDEFNRKNMRSLQQRYKKQDGYLNQFEQSLQDFKGQNSQNKKIKLKIKQPQNQKKLQQTKKKLQEQKQQSQQIQNEKKIYILKHLRKAKNRGNLLFKKIEQFRVQANSKQNIQQGNQTEQFHKILDKKQSQ